MITCDPNANARILAAAAYPGRGLLIGRSPSGRHLIQAYWNMGRSASSQNRRMVHHNNQVIVEPVSANVTMVRPELILYTAAQQVGARHLISNGIQTTALAEGIASGRGFTEILNDWTYEHDAPINTPRISGLLDCSDPARPTAVISLIRQAADPADAALRLTAELDELPAGLAFCVTTYDLSTDATAATNLCQPFPLPTEDDLNTQTERIWSWLSADFRVSLYVKFIDAADNSCKERILNRHV